MNPHPRKSKTPRELREEDYVGFFSAAEMQTGPKSRDEIIAAIKANNSYRWWRINHDFKWLKKRAKKLGLNPEDARELL